MSEKLTPESLSSGHRQRLIARFMSGGFEHMPDYEKLELMLFTAIPRRDVKPIAKQLLIRFGTLHKVLDAEVSELESVAGVGSYTIFVLKLFRSIVPLYLEQKNLRQEQFNAGEDVAVFARAKLAGGKLEQLMCIYLNSQNQLIEYEISVGTVDYTAVYPRNVVKRALDLGAVSVIMAHNHPSGSVCPSEEDIRLTNQVEKALATVDIRLLDHIIVCPYEHTSLAKMGVVHG